MDVLNEDVVVVAFPCGKEVEVVPDCDGGNSNNNGNGDVGGGNNGG
eukprot:CAMPEP_0170867366 /NCGR_PEP_ID=MMETSP0734-20130129/22739_1 /TAXON_ID=186038 /ORGANISM="Fragilariopsis kerguelensis, Strain L26-C5" /LENGTH=45 /DNA_ID= /DNA_START= /DNA_END= /DNA_ORIENTATION=